MSLWQRVVQANRPGPPEHSIWFRTASAQAVVIAIAACSSQGELSPAFAGAAIAATVAGNVLSYVRRSSPWPIVKPVLAACAIGGFVWFSVTVTHHATPGDITTVEGPLAILFTWVLCTHAFDVPARRDVAYSLAGSAALMAVAAAQSVDLALAPYVAAWLATGMWGLISMWQSAAAIRGVPWGSAIAAVLCVIALSALFVSVLPAPQVSTALVFPSSARGSQPVSSPSNLTDGSASLPAHSAVPSGPTRLGGYLGFAKSLDTGVRARLGNQVVLRVRASRPSFWIGQTYDHWNGQSWSERAAPTGVGHVIKLQTGSPFPIPLAPGQAAPLADGATDIQTFYLAQSGPNLVFHADNASRVYIQTPSLYLTSNGTLISGNSMGAGTVYTVVSNNTAATPAELQAAAAPGTGPGRSLDPLQAANDLQLPHPYPRVAALASRITAGAGAVGGPRSNVYDATSAIERWMSTHVRYSTNIPPLAPGADAVDSFLFGTRTGYCEQISTATVVMLRSLGIPAREAVGYVPGSYNPITDLYQVQAKDAHAWVQVWFPGYGWQNFDPTATVPLANPSPGSVLATSARHELARVPWVPIGVAAVFGGVVLWWWRRRRSRPPTWVHQVADDLERGGRRLGRPRHQAETLSAYGERLAVVAPGAGPQLVAVSRLVERAVYGGREPSAAEIGAALAFTRRFRSLGRRRSGGIGAAAAAGASGGAPGPKPPGEPTAPSAQLREWARASSNEAPRASRDR